MLHATPSGLGFRYTGLAWSSSQFSIGFLGRVQSFIHPGHVKRDNLAAARYSVSVAARRIFAVRGAISRVKTGFDDLSGAGFSSRRSACINSRLLMQFVENVLSLTPPSCISVPI